MKKRPQQSPRIRPCRRQITVTDAKPKQHTLTGRHGAGKPLRKEW